MSGKDRLDHCPGCAPSSPGMAHIFARYRADHDAVSFFRNKFRAAGSETICAYCVRRVVYFDVQMGDCCCKIAIFALRKILAINRMAYILNIETSTEVCSVAIGCDGDIVFHREDYRGQTHATALGVFVDEALGYADSRGEKLDAVSVSCFTCVSAQFCKSETSSLRTSSLQEAASQEMREWKVSKGSEAVRREEMDCSAVLMNRMESRTLWKEADFKEERISCDVNWRKESKMGVGERFSVEFDSEFAVEFDSEFSVEFDSLLAVERKDLERRKKAVNRLI